jgi:tyrosine-protein phosphatase YwqE
MTITCFHNHLIPGVDDGARDAEFSAAALAAYRREGVKQVITSWGR